MSHDNSFRAYGRFLATWNGLQPILDVAIVREAGLKSAEGAILVAALNQKTRLTVLRGLLAYAGGERADAVPMLVEISQAAKKQPLIQGAGIVGGENSLRFLRPEVAGRLAPSNAEYTAEEIDELADQLQEGNEALTAVLGVTQEDIEDLKRASEDVIGRRRKDKDVDNDD